MNRTPALRIGLCALLVAGLLLSIGLVPGIATAKKGGGTGSPVYTRVHFSSGCFGPTGLLGWNVTAYNVDENGDGAYDSAVFFFEGYLMKMQVTTGGWAYYQVTSPARSYELIVVAARGYTTSGKCDLYGVVKLDVAPGSIYQGAIQHPWFEVDTELTIPNLQAVTLNFVACPPLYPCNNMPQRLYGVINGNWYSTPDIWSPYTFGSPPQYVYYPTSWYRTGTDFTQETAAYGHPSYPLAYQFLTTLPKNLATTSEYKVVYPTPLESTYQMVDMVADPAHPGQNWPFDTTVDLNPVNAIDLGLQAYILQNP